MCRPFFIGAPGRAHPRCVSSLTSDGKIEALHLSSSATTNYSSFLSRSSKLLFPGSNLGSVSMIVFYLLWLAECAILMGHNEHLYLSIHGGAGSDSSFSVVTPAPRSSPLPLSASDRFEGWPWHHAADLVTPEASTIFPAPILGSPSNCIRANFTIVFFDRGGDPG